MWAEAGSEKPGRVGGGGSWGLWGHIEEQPLCQEEGTLLGAMKHRLVFHSGPCISRQHCASGYWGFFLPFWGRKHGLASSLQPHCSASSSRSYKLPQPPGSLPLLTSVHSGLQNDLCKIPIWHTPIPNVPAAPPFCRKISVLAF